MLPAFLIALSTLVSEDLACISAGVLVAQHRIGWTAALLGATLGIFFGDLLLVVAGRYPGLLRIKAVLPLGLLESKTTHVLLWSRFTPGLRLPTYLGAGILRIPFRKVVPPLAAGAILWTPLLVGLAALLGAVFVKTLLQALEAIVATAVVWHVLSNYERRRRVLAFFLRFVRWEFWPAAAAYLPVIPYMLWLGIKHRGMTLFTVANPGIPTGGLLGESKSAILDHLSREPEHTARFKLIPPDKLETRFAQFQNFLHSNQLSFPVVLKPDMGERGSGVAIIRSEQEVHAYLEAATTPVIVQEYVAGVEYGVFYTRMPGEPAGRVTSITEKRLPFVTGDGSSTISRLILDDPRAFLLHAAYLGSLKRPASDIPAAGERVPLVEVGSHCRGAIFLDARHLLTPELEQAIERVSRCHPGFYFGRYDVRAESIDALQKGKFKVLELNGVAAEPAHIYDPAVNLWEAYRTMYRHWRTAYEIGAANRRNGAAPATWQELYNTWRSAQARRSSITH
jgi:membrane protein DedA with SNARE-associated domain